LEKRNLIGHILIDLGYLKEEHVNEARRKQMAYPELKLGEILIGDEYPDPGAVGEGFAIAGDGAGRLNRC
jgi:hypothetical protein